MERLSHDELAQVEILGPLLPFVVALMFFVAGAWQCSHGCWGIGLALIGIAAIIGGFGGTLEGGYGMLKASGTAGFVLIVFGLIAYAFITHC